jgi:oxygen-independent coproporphyrinogen-3 oxidase
MKADLAAWQGPEQSGGYPSYPTVPHFSAAVGPETYANWLTAVPQHAIASLDLQVPFSRPTCWSGGFDSTVGQRDEPVAFYEAALCCEIDLVARQIGRRMQVDRVHFGAGTPTIMVPESLADLIGTIRKSFFVLPSAEIGVEIDPRTLSSSTVDALALGGVNRASLAVQSFDPVVQYAMNRVQSFEEIAAAVEKLRRAGISALNFELVYGLPHQTIASCLDTVRRCTELRPARFAVFGCLHASSAKEYQGKLKQEWLPDSGARYDQACAMANALKEAGYVQVGLDHFALPSDEMAVARAEGRLRRSFQGYTTSSSTVLLGFGAGAIGSLPHGHVQNDVDIGSYSEAIATGRFATAKGYVLTGEDRLRGEIIERIMCDFGVDLAAICERHGAGAETMLQSAPRLKELASEGIIELKGAWLKVADNSRLLAGSVAAAFDAHLDPA